MIYNEETKEYVKEMNSVLKEKFCFRIYDDFEDKSRERDDYMRDYARVLYSSSFRRLQGKMQLLGIDSWHFHRNRLTHSLEVAQIARGIATDLGLDTTLVVETCSLAHDIGNPPFGHHGEEVLNELAYDIGGFEGNAQTLRILTTLEKKHHKYRGLNLTFRTLMGVVKYFCRFGENKKFIYDEDYDMISERLLKNNLPNMRTLDVQIMDLADEIAYAAHDLEDTLSLGYLTIDELLYEFGIDPEYTSAYFMLKNIVDQCREFACKSEFLKTSEEYSFLFRKELTSRIVNTLVKDINLRIDISGNRYLGFSQCYTLSKGLKKLLFKTLLRRPSVQLYEKQGEKIIKGLFDVYIDKNYNINSLLLPPEFRSRVDGCERKRLIIDYIAGMMDSYARLEYQKYYGPNSLDRYYFNE